MATKSNINNNVDYTGKIPPQALEIEEAILGALMIEPDAIDRVELKPEYFYKDCHQKIFASIKRLSTLREPIDLLTVTNDLRKHNQLDEVGGPFYITKLTSTIASSSHIENHAKIITQKFVQRDIIRISTEAQQMAFDEMNDPYDILVLIQKQFDLLNNFETDEPKTFDQVLKESLNNAQKRQKLKLEGKTIGIPTPLSQLTKWTCGWQGKQFIIIAGRPGMGKTAVAIACMRSAAIHNYSSVLFTLEMSDTSVADRMIIGESDINADDFRRGEISPYQWEILDRSFQKMSDYKICIDDKPKSINKICSKARTLHRKGKCDFVLVDYIQLAGDDSLKSNSNREQEISTISRKLKLLALELNIPVIGFSQLNRQVENRPGKTPMLSDLRESGSLEQDADIVIFIHRPEKYGIIEDQEGNSLKGIGHAMIEKQRDGQTGVIQFKYNESVTALYDLDYQFESRANTDFDKQINDRPF